MSKTNAGIRIVNTFQAPGAGHDHSEGRSSLDNAVEKEINSFRHENSIEIKAKVVVVGDMAVGKTNLLMRFVDEKYHGEYKPTIAIDFRVRNYQLFDVPLSLCIWDTAGQERFQCLTKSFYKGASACIVSFDLSNPTTFATTERWLTEMQSVTGPDVPCFLVGLKSDLQHRVSYIDAANHAKRLKMEYWEVSAKEDRNVKELFDRIAILTLEHAVRGWMRQRGRVAHTAIQDVVAKDKTRGVKLHSPPPPPPERKSGCC